MFPGATDNTKSLKPAIRAFLIGQERPILQIAAHNAFWRLKKTLLLDILSEVDGVASPNASLFETLFAFGQACFGFGGWYGHEHY